MRRECVTFSKEETRKSVREKEGRDEKECKRERGRGGERRVSVRKKEG